jgi:hypothetical protein
MATGENKKLVATNKVVHREISSTPIDKMAETHHIRRTGQLNV